MVLTNACAVMKRLNKLKVQDTNVMQSSSKKQLNFMQCKLKFIECANNIKIITLQRIYF